MVTRCAVTDISLLTWSQVLLLLVTGPIVLDPNVLKGRTSPQHYTTTIGGLHLTSLSFEDRGQDAILSGRSTLTGC